MTTENENSSSTASNVVPLKSDDLEAAKKRLPRFIQENVETIVGEWETFARTLTPSSAGMTPLALRDHIHQILKFIVSDMASDQSPAQQKDKSLGEKDSNRKDTAAQTHAAVRFAGGFGIGQMVSEYRALRASIIKLWSNVGPAFDARDIGDMTRFNESIDQEMTESVNFYTEKVAYSKDILTGMLGHDLRGPLQAIMLSAELTLHLGKLNERQTMLMKNVIESSTRMKTLINDLLDVSRARFGARLSVARLPMNMAFVAHQVIDEIRIVHPTRTIALSDSGDLRGEWDKARIGQVFSNLLANAIQYSFQDSTITVDLKGTAEMVTLMVHNSGVPIPPDKLRMIFDPLTRASPSDSLRPSGNLGLGLFITKEVVTAHGGTIEVKSSDLDGSIFTAKFPRHLPSQHPEGSESPMVH